MAKLFTPHVSDLEGRWKVTFRVECINAGPLDGSFGIWMDGDSPVVGQIYTVLRELTDGGGDRVYHLVELRRGPIARSQWGEDAGYRVLRFRPVVERKTDISIFTKMLTGKRVDA